MMYGILEWVARDYAKSVHLYKLAAAHGHLGAQNNLAVIYENGEGVVQDYLEAHMWMNLASASGHKDAQRARGVIAKEMTPQQIAKAQ